jgi:hypothetical protein
LAPIFYFAAPVHKFGCCYVHFGPVISEIKVPRCKYFGRVEVFSIFAFTKSNSWFNFVFGISTVGSGVRCSRRRDGFHYRSKMCIAGPQVCNGKYENVSKHLETHLGWANGQQEEKRQEKRINYSSTPKTPKYQPINKEPTKRKHRLKKVLASKCEALVLERTPKVCLPSRAIG